MQNTSLPQFTQLCPTQRRIETTNGYLSLNDVKLTSDLLHARSYIGGVVSVSAAMLIALTYISLTHIFCKYIFKEY